MNYKYALASVGVVILGVVCGCLVNDLNCSNYANKRIKKIKNQLKEMKS